MALYVELLMGPQRLGVHCCPHSLLLMACPDLTLQTMLLRMHNWQNRYHQLCFSKPQVQAYSSCCILLLSRLVECIALAKLPLTTTQHKQLHTSIDENLRHPTAAIQTAACAALAAFAASYISTGDQEAVHRTSEKYLALLTDPNVAARRGAAAALGALPCWLLQPLSHQILAGLAAATQVSVEGRAPLHSHT